MKQVKPNNNSSKQGKTKAKATQKNLVLETVKSLVGSEKSVGEACGSSTSFGSQHELH